MPKKIVIGLIRVYQFFSRRLPVKTCRFYPTCSEYMALSIEKYGVACGLWRGLKRIWRCRPGQPGGVDMP
ncbi:protein containing haemolytic domain [Candidatus Termititenax persephonae]|uniref:Putative membrane protein insertion efficiency factor n=1 Tax=Candidatus Termititenax persephonae TaxID=2218525 RepID=A0A388TIR3_9BACT|nr:protein containing haemolytic domain [Candidatus Termititenax persephonae]